jgi:membrane protease YdiL (CAAX protease family)
MQFVTGLLIATCINWAILFWVRRRASSWVVREPRRLWTADLVDVLVTFAVLFLGTSVGIMLIAPESSGELAKMSPDERVSAIYLQVAVSLSTIVLSTCLVLWRHGLRPRDLGWSLRGAGRDVWLGVLAFLVLAPPVYALQLFLVTRFESHHPLVDLLKNGAQPSLIAACVVSAVVAAPIAEEYLFRGMLQSWLEWLAVWHEGLGEDRHGVTGVKPSSERSVQPSVREQQAAIPANPLLYGRVSHGAEASEAGGDGGDTSAAAWSPVVASAVVFSLLHYSHGPDWIPLFFFALGLGYLYRQSHRLLPCIVVHFLLNSCSLAMFFFENHTV